MVSSVRGINSRVGVGEGVLVAVGEGITVGTAVDWMRISRSVASLTLSTLVKRLNFPIARMRLPICLVRLTFSGICRVMASASVVTK